MALTDKISDAILGGRSQSFLSDGLVDVLFDVTIDFTEQSSFEVSSHTIEDGSDISDHIDSKPTVFTLNAILTDDDWDLLDPVEFFDEPIDDRLETLRLWRELKPVLTYYGHEIDIEDVIIVDYTLTKNIDISAGVGIAISFQAVNVATFQVDQISLSTATAKGVTSQGSNTRTGAATLKKNTNASFLYRAR